MNAKTITAAELADKENPADGWYIIEAAGNHPQTCTLPDGTVLSFTQELTPAVLAAVAAAGVPQDGLFIDTEHSGAEGGSTAAMGWVRELAMCGDALAARIEWTPAGLPMVQGRLYKHFSTVYPVRESEMRTGTVHPTRLTGLTLTNMPNNAAGQPAITNRVQPTSPGNPAGKDQTQKDNNTMNPDIPAALGLPSDATDEEVLAKIKELNNRLADAEQAADAAAAKEADAIIAGEEKDAGITLDDEDRKEAKELIVGNRDHGIKYTRLLCQSKRSTATAGPRRYTGTPAPAPAAKAEDPEMQVLNRAHALCAEANKQGKRLNFHVAVAQARREQATTPAKH